MVTGHRAHIASKLRGASHVLLLSRAPEQQGSQPPKKLPSEAPGKVWMQDFLADTRAGFPDHLHRHRAGMFQNIFTKTMITNMKY